MKKSRVVDGGGERERERGEETGPNGRAGDEEENWSRGLTAFNSERS
jgi:hypothetical protein